MILALGVVSVNGFSSPSRFAALRTRCDRGNRVFCENIQSSPPTQRRRRRNLLTLTMSEEAAELLNASENTSTDADQLKIEREMQMQKFDIDWNAYINIGIIMGVTILALSKLATVDVGLMRGWTAAEMAVRIPVDNWASYETVLHAAPIETKAATSATVYAIGDIIAQRTEGKSYGDLDRWRTLRSLLAGCIGHGPLSHVWYDWSEQIFTEQFHWVEWWSFFPKVAIDQLTWGPFWNNTYILLLGLMQFRKPKDIVKEMKDTTVPLIMSGLKLWPLAHCITYGVVPVENRLLWVDLVEIIWVTILASAAAEASAGAKVDGDGDEKAAEVGE